MAKVVGNGRSWEYSRDSEYFTMRFLPISINKAVVQSYLMHVLRQRCRRLAILDTYSAEKLKFTDHEGPIRATS